MAVRAVPLQPVTANRSLRAGAIGCLKCQRRHVVIDRLAIAFRCADILPIMITTHIGAYLFTGIQHLLIGIDNVGRSGRRHKVEHPSIQHVDTGKCHLPPDTAVRVPMFEADHPILLVYGH